MGHTDGFIPQEISRESPQETPKNETKEQPLNRKELATAIAADLETDRKSVEEFLASFIDVVTATVAGGEPITITGFAKFARVERAARMGRNPQTGEAIKIAASRKVRITPLKAFKDAVLASKRGGLLGRKK